MIICTPEIEGFNKDVSTGIVGYGTMYHVFDKAFKKLGHKTEQKAIPGEVYIHFAPPQFAKGLKKRFPGAKKRFYFTMWESIGMPQKWIDELNESVDCVFVPNEFGVQLFKAQGLKVPIYAINLGINDSFKKPKLREKTTPFNFFHFNAGEPRKGWFTMLDAFIEEFGNDKDVNLVVKNSSVHERQLNKSISILPQHLFDKIKVYRGAYTINQLLDIAYNCHCFVFPALGEGYGLTPREMLATGMPTIVSDGHSFSELPEYYLKVETEKKKGAFAYLPNNAEAISGLAFIHDAYKDYYLWYAKKDLLKAKMRQVYNDYNTYSQQAFESAKEVAKNEDTVEHAQKLLKIVDSFLD